MINEINKMCFDAINSNDEDLIVKIKEALTVIQKKENVDEIEAFKKFKFYKFLTRKINEKRITLLKLLIIHTQNMNLIEKSLIIH